MNLLLTSWQQQHVIDKLSIYLCSPKSTVSTDNCYFHYPRLDLESKINGQISHTFFTLDRVSKASLRQRNLNIVYNFTTVFELLADRNLKPHLLTLGGLFHLIIKRKVEPVERWINCCLDLTLQRTWLS